MLSWAHIGLAGSFGALLIGGCGARAVSRKTPIYFIKWIQLPYELIRYLHLIYVHISSYFWTLQMQIMVWKIGQKSSLQNRRSPGWDKNPTFFADHVGWLPLVNSPLLLFQFRIASSHPPPTWPFVVWWLRRDMCSPTKLVCLCLLSSHNTFEDEDQLRGHVCQFTARCDRGWISD